MTLPSAKKSYSSFASVRFRSVAIIIAIILFPVCNVLQYSVSPILGYYDELVSILGIILLLCDFNKLERKIQMSCLFLGLITLIGLLSNLLSRVTTNVFYILVDVLMLWKIYLVFVAGYSLSLCRKAVNHSSLRILGYISKITIVVVSVCAVISQFVDIGMSINTDELFGVFQPFGFVWKNMIQTAWLLICCMFFVEVNGGKTVWIYKCLFYLTCILTTGTLVVGLATVYLICDIFKYLSKGKLRIRIYHIVFIAVLLIAVGYNSLFQYLTGNAARAVLIRGGIKTALTYFPLGSGFATYGSEMANRVYSSLYYDYGFDLVYGLSRDNQLFLNDTYLASVLGQFGIFGLALFILFLVCLFLMINNDNLLKNEKTPIVASIILLFVSMTISATSKSIMGCMVFLSIGLILGYRNNEENDYPFLSRAYDIKQN